MKRLYAEFFGTFALVFSGTGAVVFNHLSGGAITHVGIALVFGLIVLALVYTFGDVSGAHINPAVSIGFAVAGRFPWRDVVPYVLAQVAGATAASFLLKSMFATATNPAQMLVAHSNVNWGATIAKSGLEWQCFVLEAWLTWLLMLVVLHVSTGAKEKGITAGIAVGAIIALEALFAGPICGASMNPARSFAPALAAGKLDTLPIYIVAPILGAILAVLTFKLTQPTTQENGKN